MLDGVIKCLSGEVFVFVHKIIPISNLPSLLWFVLSWYNIDQVAPAQVSLKSHDILDHLVVVIAEKNAGVVLVLNVEFHWGFNEGGDSDVVWFVLFIKPIED